MTTYQVFNRRVTRSLLTLIAVFLLAATMRAELPRTPLTDSIVYWGTIVTVVGLLWRLTQVRCLFCRKPVGVASLAWINRGGGPPGDAACPNCGAPILRTFPGITDESN